MLSIIPELHLFLIWPNARYRQEDIIEDIAKSFEIVRILEVTWSEPYYSSNLTRFYGTRLPDRSFKEGHCGKGPFVVIVVRDHNPNYGLRNTSHGPAEVNINMFDRKHVYRNWTGGGHRIYTTDNVIETDHNLVLLTGLSADDFSSVHSTPFTGDVEFLQQDLPGAVTWESMEQLFYVLNHTTTYVVLRNFEGLPYQYLFKTHGDIDLLAESSHSLRYILNTQPVFPNSTRVLHFAIVNNEKVQFNLRSVGDGYYDTLWEKAILNNRIYNTNGFYHPSEKDHFYSILYHALIHKPAVAEDYIVRLCKMAEVHDVPLRPSDFKDRNLCVSLLDKYLMSKGYSITEPSDISVYFNRLGTPVKKVSIARIIASSKTMGGAIRRIIEQATDCSSDSPELQTPKIIAQTTLRYHFSKERLFPFSTVALNNSMRIVEFGAQTGIITRFLAERCGYVLAIEPNADLAHTARVRCKNYSNVNFVSEMSDIKEYTAGFDCAVMFIPRPDKPGNGYQMCTSLRKWLEIASILIKESGFIILAVDNSRSVMDPLLDHRSKGLSNKEIRELLNQTGYRSQDFYFTFPDHLFPQIIFTEEALKLDSNTIGSWAASTVFTHANGSSVRMPLFVKLFNKLLTEGTFGEKAPAFVVVAGKKSCSTPSWLLKKYTGFPRRIEAHTETDLVRVGGALRVIKKGESIDDGLFRFRPCSNEPLHDGYTIETKLVTAVSANDSRGFISILTDFLYYLNNTFPVNTDIPSLGNASDQFISGDTLDCNFGNVVVKGDDWHLFDLEWQCSLPLPMSFVLFRAISIYFNTVDTAKVMALFSLPYTGSLSDCIMKIFMQLPPKYRIQRTVFNYYVDFEDRFYSFAFDRKRDKPSFLELYLSLYHYRKTMCSQERESIISFINREYQGAPELNRIRGDFS